jgi:hypothetical protein
MERRAAVLNTITTAGRTMLLTRTGGVAIHLTQSADDSDAVPIDDSDWRFHWRTWSRT